MPPTPALPDRKKTQLDHKIQSLKSATLAEWIRQSEKGGVFQIHNSQMNVLTQMIDSLSTIIQDAASHATLSDVQTVEQAILIAFQVWEFFRSKLAQRLESEIQPFLRICDELAWRCYEPFRIAAGSQPATKEPPLVFLDSEWSPFVVERRKALQIGAVPRSTLQDFGFDEAVKQMPFAVIGLPWYQRNHLPDALVVCHEVGHAVELDFDLGDSIDQLLEAAVPTFDRLKRWKAWRREIFADTFACIAAGPSFVSALADALVSLRTQVVAIHETYPSDYLRILYNVELLRGLSHQDHAKEIEAWWRSLYDGSHVLQDYEDDLKNVASGLLTWTPPVFGGKLLRQILRFGPVEQMDAANAAAKVIDIEAPSITDIRIGLSASRIAFATSPAQFSSITPPARTTPQLHLQKHLLERVCKNDLRDRDDEAAAKDRLTYIRDLGADLGQKLLRRSH